MSGKLRTADNTVSHRVTWPHEVIYSMSAEPATYEHLSSMAFVDGYLTVRLREPPRIQVLMLEHLQELREDREHYGWPVVRAYHAAWLKDIEQGRAAWGDASAKLRLRRALVWHRVVAQVEILHIYPAPYQLASTYQPRQTFNRASTTQSQTQVQKGGGVSFSPPANPEDQACPAFNTGTCFDNSAHLSLSHVCSYCLCTGRWHCYGI